MAYLTAKVFVGNSFIVQIHTHRVTDNNGHKPTKQNSVCERASTGLRVPTSDVGLINEGKNTYQAEQYEESKRKAPTPVKERGKFICQIISRETDEAF